MSLTFRTEITAVERALVRGIRQALGKRNTVANAAALRAVPVLGASLGLAVEDGALVYVTSAALAYQFEVGSTAADDGATVIQPTQIVGSLPGRWLVTASAVASGYLVDVRLYEGEQSEDEILERILGRVPSVMVRWQSSEHVAKSQVPGALYRVEESFDVWAVSANYRAGVLPAAIVGSPIAAEAAADPGVNALIGDLQTFLAGLTGEDVNETGIAYCEIGHVEPVYRSLAERRFVFSLGLKVHASVQAAADPADVPLTRVDVSHLEDGTTYLPIDQVKTT